VNENETVLAERDYHHLQTLIINPLNINTPITHLQSSYNQSTWLPTQSHLCSIYR